MPRRSPSQQAADLRAKAAALEWRAKVASDPILKAAIKLRAMLEYTDGELVEIDSPRTDLLDSLDRYIGGIPE